MDLIFKNGTVVTPQGMFEADVAVKDGKIAALGKNLDLEAKEIKDVSGRLVLPGSSGCPYPYGYAFRRNRFGRQLSCGNRAAAWPG